MDDDNSDRYAAYLQNMLAWFRRGERRFTVPDMDWRYDDEDSSLWGVVKGMSARFWVELEVRGSTRTYIPTLTVNVDGFDTAKVTAEATEEIVAAAKRGEFCASSAHRPQHQAGHERPE